MSTDTQQSHGPGLPTYFAIFFSLMILTGVTVWVAYHDWGALNNVIALSIASLKAMLVILFFMHVRYEKRMIGAFLLVGVLWLLLIIAFVLLDVWARNAWF